MNAQFTETPRKLLRRKEAAEILGISIRQLLNITNDGKIPFVRIGGTVRSSVRYRPADVEAFINSRLIHAKSSK